jgi:hypothetical protein
MHEVTEYILDKINEVEIIEKDDFKKLVNLKDHFDRVLENTFIWRTQVQKKSIISDDFHPTDHSKFHQAILEQKVQFEQMLYLSRDFELRKLDLEEVQEDLNDLLSSNKSGTRLEINKKRMEIKINFGNYELKNMKILMKYRLKEVFGWQVLIDDLYKKMKDSGLSEQEIWSKEEHEIKSFLFIQLNRLQGIRVTKDPAELKNLVGLAKAAIQMAKDCGMYGVWKAEMNAMQLNSLSLINMA